MSKYISHRHSEQSIQAALYKYYRKRKMKYMLSSVYIYDWSSKKRKKNDKWEDDFFFVDKEYKTWTIEIKRDRQDFLRGELVKKAEKIALLTEAYENNNKDNYFLPNYFYYCAPVGMIKLEELPKFAGLIEVDDDHNLIFVTDVMQLHDYVDKERLMDKLLKKFYNKSYSDEQLYISFIQEWRKAGDSLAKRNEAVMSYERKKRIG